MGIVSNKENYLFYERYIRSSQWASKKAEFFASGCYRSKQCYVCQAPWREGFHVHHMTYRRLGEERLNDLAVVCSDCHKLIHEEHAKQSLLAKRAGNKPPSIKRTSKRLRKDSLQKQKDEARIEKQVREMMLSNFTSKLNKLSKKLEPRPVE